LLLARNEVAELGLQPILNNEQIALSGLDEAKLTAGNLLK
jgi:hypothetical protein